MRIIFLDMDGVLATPRAFVAQQDKICQEDKWIDPIAVRFLNMLCQGCEASVVVSSSWRIGRTREQFLTILTRNGFVGELHQDWDTRQLPHPAIRGDEVKEWLGRHPEVTKHVILDDDSDFHPEQPLIKTDTVDGMSQHHLREAFMVLTGDQWRSLTAMRACMGVRRG